MSINVSGDSYSEFDATSPLASPVTPISSEPDPSDMVDLGKYVQVIIDWWREILTLAIVAGAVAGVGMNYQAKNEVAKYTAVSTVAIARIKTDVSFDERFRTLSAQDANLDLTNAGSRRAALAGLVYNSLVAVDVINELGHLLSDDEKIPANLLSMVDADIVEGFTARTEGDLIKISVVANSPTKSAAIANTWAKYYVAYVNNLYGQVPSEIIESVRVELGESELKYETTQRELEQFVATNQMGKLQRLIDEKKGLINSLQSAKQIAIDTLVEEELNARRQVISAYMNALSENRLLGFNKEQQAKREILNALFETEVENRLEALKRDRNARETLFAHLSNAQVASTTAIVDEEIQNRINQLRLAYSEQTTLQGFLDRANILRNHIEAAGSESVESTGRSLALLKAQLVYMPTATNTPTSFADAPPPGMPDASGMAGAVGTTVNIDNGNTSQIQLNLDVAIDNPGSWESQLADVNALIASLDTQLAIVATTIEAISRDLLVGDNYPQIARLLSHQFNDALSQSDNAGANNVGDFGDDVEEVIEFEFGFEEGETEMVPVEELEPVEELPEVAQVPLRETLSLSQSIVEQYADLLSVGELATNNSKLWKDSDLLNQIISLYPELYKLGPVSELAEDVPTDNPLTALSLDKARELLQLQGLEDIPAYTAAAEPLIRAIDKMETEIQVLQAQLEAEQARERQLLQNRDLTWGAYSTMNNKVTELQLSKSTTNSEVRLAAPAVEPVSAQPGTNVKLMAVIGGVAGLVLGIVMAYAAWFLGYQPFFRRNRAPLPTAA